MVFVVVVCRWVLKRSSLLTNKTHRNYAEETSSEREKQTLRGQRTRALFYTERTFVHLESIASVVFIGREWMFSARERFRESFLLLTFKPKMSGFWKSITALQRRRDVLCPFISIETDSCDIFSSTFEQVKRVFCESSGALVPKDKAVKRFIVRNMVESAAIRDLQEACAYETYTLPKMYRKVHYSISAAIHSKVVRVRSREARRIREPPRRAPRKQEK